MKDVAHESMFMRLSGSSSPKDDLFPKLFLTRHHFVSANHIWKNQVKNGRLFPCWLVIAQKASPLNDLTPCVSACDVTEEQSQFILSSDVHIEP